MVATAGHTLVTVPPRILILLGAFCTFTMAASNGMSVNSFQGLQDVLEVECSSERVETYFDVFTVSLFLLKNDKILAFVSPKSRECTTSSYFSACVVDSVNPRLSRVKTLLVDLPEGHTESFGCNVTSLNPQRRFVTTSWFLDVRKESE